MATGWKGLVFSVAFLAAGIIAGAMPGSSQESFVGTKGCGTCHPAQKKAYDAHKHAKSKGTIANEEGIGCEACHGAGQGHVALGAQLADLKKSKGDLKILGRAGNKGNAMCAKCHAANDNGKLKLAADDLTVHMQQVTELNLSQKGKVYKMTCVDCHDPHATSVKQEGITKKCLECHTGKFKIEIKIKAMSKLSCEACHMPYVTTASAGTMEQGFHKGEVRTHLFGVTVDEKYKLNDGSNRAALNADGLARMTVEMACYSCHKTGKAPDMTREKLLKNAEKVHK